MIKRVDDLVETCLSKMEVDACGLETGVSQQSLNHKNISAGL